MNDYLILLLCIILVIGIYYVREYLLQQNKVVKKKSKKTSNLMNEKNINYELQSLMNVDLNKYKNTTIKLHDDETNFSD